MQATTGDTPMGRKARRLRPSLPLVGAAVLILLMILPPIPSAETRHTAGPARWAATPFAPGSPCYGAYVPGRYTGALTVARGVGSSPTVANVTVNLVYQYTLNYTSSGGRTTFSCNTAVQGSSTNASGGVILTAPVPQNSCTGGSCSSYTGPIGPISAFMPAGLPAGYFLSVRFSGSTVALAFVQALASVSLSLLPRTTVSVDAPVTVLAHASAGDGSPSPAAILYDWHLSGTGWSLNSTPSSSGATVEASPQAGPGLLSLWTNGTFNGTLTNLPESTVQLTAVATSISTGSVNPTSVDAGTPATFSVVGTGAAGYNYSAWVNPGLNGSSLALPCASSPAPGGEVTLRCSARGTYPTSGTAQPTANLTNGYSGAGWTYAQVLVAPGLALTLTPDPAAVYVRSNLTLRAGVVANTGTAPFGPACLDPGSGGLRCSFAGGPSWSFFPSYPASGTYVARLSVADWAGANRSLAIPVEVFDRPSLQSIRTTENAPGIGHPVVLNTSVSGGALPLAYWWNDSSPEGILYAGNLAADGAISLRYVPVTAGSHRITLTVVDGLGSAVANVTDLVVVAGNPVELETADAAAEPTTVAGSPTPIEWTAVDSAHQVVTTYHADASLLVIEPSGPGAGLFWLNFSATSLVGNASAPMVALPASAWSNGYLNVTLTLSRAGVSSVALVAPLPVAGVPAGGLRVLVAADPLHLALVHPQVYESGRRANATLWQIVDRFGNPSATEYVVVQSVFGPVVFNSDSPVRVANGVALVWVNYSAPADGAGTVYVLSKFGDALLPPLWIPALVAGLSPYVLAAGLSAVGLASAGVVYGFRRRRRTMVINARGAVADEELERLARGRAHVLDRATERPRSASELAAGFDDPRAPDRAEVAEWIGSLVAEGSLRADAGPNGSVRFVVVDRGGDASPRVTLDPALLDSALARRESPPGEDGELSPDGEPAAR